jgi:hypothetical protein
MKYKVIKPEDLHKYGFRMDEFINDELQIGGIHLYVFCDENIPPYLTYNCYDSWGQEVEENAESIYELYKLITNLLKDGIITEEL